MDADGGSRQSRTDSQERRTGFWAWVVVALLCLPIVAVLAFRFILYYVDPAGGVAWADMLRDLAIGLPLIVGIIWLGRRWLD